MSCRAGKVAQWLKAHPALVEDPTLIPSAHIGLQAGSINNCPWPP